MGTIAFVLIILATIVFPLIPLLTMFRVDRKTSDMVGQRKREDAIVSEECMIHEGFRECPGMAQVADGILFIDSAFFDLHHAIPLSDVALIKEVGGFRRFTGRNGWTGKWRFHLKTPKTSNLVIGVKNHEAWRDVFVRNRGRSAR